MNQSENLYDKLNNVHASLRKQKEDAFRTKQLAEQRLAIQKQDREGVEKKGADTRAKLRTLKERAVEMKNVNGVNEAENKQFEKEVRSVMLGFDCGIIMMNRVLISLNEGSYCNMHYFVRQCLLANILLLIYLKHSTSLDTLNFRARRRSFPVLRIKKWKKPTCVTTQCQLPRIFYVISVRTHPRMI